MGRGSRCVQGEPSKLGLTTVKGKWKEGGCVGEDLGWNAALRKSYLDWYAYRAKIAH